MRRELVRLLRATHLIQVADRFASWRAARREARANAQYQASHPRQHFPDPALVFEVTARADYQTYQETGRAHAQLIADMLRETSLPNTPRILDWGCGPGRVLSHLSAALNAPGAQFEGCDPNSQAVRAARRAAPEAKIERLASKPPSPYANEAFDAIYGVSVLTHLPLASATQWVRELARIVRTTGVVLLTSHGARVAGHLGAGSRARFDAGDYVEIGGARPGSRTFVAYFNEDAGMRLFSPYFDSIEFRPSATENVLGQDVWLLREPRRGGGA